MKRVLLTGGNGFIGATCARRLIGDGNELHLLLLPSFEPWRLKDLAGHYRPCLVDLRDAEGVERVVKEVRPEWVFHLAAYGAYSWQTDVRRIFETNVLGTLNLFEACRRLGFDAFVNTGSSSEYGCKHYGPPETDLPEPNSPYAAAKVAATMYCWQMARATGLVVSTIRLYSIYGPYEEPNRLIPALLLYGLRGRCPPLVDPAIARDFVHVDDAVDAYLRLARRSTAERGGVYNVGSGRQTTLRELIELSTPLFPGRKAPVWGTMPAPPGTQLSGWPNRTRSARNWGGNPATLLLPVSVLFSLV